MKNYASEPLAKRISSYHVGLGIKADRQEICSFTLERCLLNPTPGEKEEDEKLCPFTLEPVCMKTRAMSAGWD
jgi:hypothetical protein